MKFFNPWGFLALMGIPIVILMYLLKQKYQEKQISSLFLWKKAVALTQASEPWQKLRKNILFFLQIAAVLFIAMALANPFGMWNKKITNYVLVLDCSMSMQAEDESPSRFENAKEQINELIQSSPPQTEITMICLDESPYIAVNASSQKQEVKRALQSQKAGNGGVNWEKAYPLIEMAKKQNQGQIIIYTDHPFEMGTLDAKQILLGKGQDNCAITLLSHLSEKENAQVLCRVKNYGKTKQEKTVTLFSDDVIQDVVNITLKSGEERDIVFSGLSLEAKKIRAELSPGDILLTDDVAFDTINQQEKRKVLLATDGNVFLEKALLLLSDIELYKTGTDNMDSLEGYSLYIFDGVIPKKLPKDGYYFFLNMPQENDIVEMKGETDALRTVKGTNQEDFSFAQDIEFDLSQSDSMITPKWASNLLESDGDAVAIAGENEGRKIMAFSFNINNSDFPLKKEFPIFMYQALNWFFPNSSQQLSNITSGKFIQIPLEPSTKEAVVVLPSGKKVPVAPPFPAESFRQTEEMGFYTLKQTGQEGLISDSIFAVNPKTEGESDISQIYSNIEGKNDATIKNKISSSLRNPILLLLLCLLLVEWWVNCHEY